MNGNKSDDNEYWAQQERQTRELRESLPEDLKAHTAKQITDYLNSLSPENKNIWVDRIGNDPILQRIIYYVSSPPEEIDLRFQMITKNDIDIEFNIKYACFVQTLPENRNEVLRIYLRKLSETFLRVFTADCQKKVGLTGTIAELRDNCLRIEQAAGGRKTIIDHSPWMRYELLKTQKEKNMTIYALDDSPITNRFNVDPFLIGWIQTFDNPNIRDEAFSDKILVMVVDQNGNKIAAPDGFRNPFYFSLLEKYEPLLRKIHNQWKSNFETMKKKRQASIRKKRQTNDAEGEDNRKIPDTTDPIEYEDVVSCFYAVLKDSHGFVNPKAINRKVIDLYRGRKGSFPNEVPVSLEIVEMLDLKRKSNQNDPQQVLLTKEAWEAVMEDEPFRTLFTSDETKTPRERQYMHRHIEKIKNSY